MIQHSLIQKIVTISRIVILSIADAGLYGIIHDQVTYSISPEYFIKFKYIQFKVEPTWFGGNRPTVAVIGFLATWWIGLFIGIGLALTSLLFQDQRTRYKTIWKAISIVVSLTMITSFFGFLYGKFYLVKAGVTWWFPPKLIDKNAFIIVGAIHDFSYIGGLLGLLAGICYLVILKRLQRKPIRLH